MTKPTSTTENPLKQRTPEHRAPSPPFLAISDWHYNYRFLSAPLTIPIMDPEGPVLVVGSTFQGMLLIVPSGLPSPGIT